MAHILVAATPAPGHVNPMLPVAQHLGSLGHSITFLSGSLFHDQAAALGFRFVPLSGKADYNYVRVYEEFPEIATAQPGPEAMNATCIYTGIDPIPDQYRAVRQILTERPTDLIVTDVYFWGVFPRLLGPKDARPPVLTCGVLPLMLSSQRRITVFRSRHDSRRSVTQSPRDTAASRGDAAFDGPVQPSTALLRSTGTA